jgi:hypothetical protein
MPAPKLNACSKILLVEGYGDLLFYAEALEWLQRLDGVYIKECGGSELVIKLEAFLNPGLLAEKTSIGVIADADINPVGNARKLETQLSRITGQEVINGAWTAGPPSIGLLIVPGGGRAGEIESLVWEAWSNDPANEGPKRCVESFLACMAEQGHAAHSEDKGRIGAILSVLSDEDPRLGPGARATRGRRVFNFERPEFQPLLEFLRGF